MYRRTLAGGPLSKHDLVLDGRSFYAGANSVLKVLNRIREEDDIEELKRSIERHGRTRRESQHQKKKAEFDRVSA